MVRQTEIITCRSSAPGVEVVTLVEDGAEVPGGAGVDGAWDELSLGVPLDEGVDAVAGWLRELRWAETQVKTDATDLNHL